MRRYFTFKHKPGENSPTEKTVEIVKRAIELNAALMDYEYGKWEGTKLGPVSLQLNFIKDNLREGDILFLRGDDRIYAYGKIIKPRMSANVTLRMDEIIKTKSRVVNGIDYSSGKYHGCVHFEDCPIFYEYLDGKDNWGQRIDVDAWNYYSRDGIFCKPGDNFINGGNWRGVLREMKEDTGKMFINQLKENFMCPELQLLEKNKNLILTGAPGTGKTFLAEKMALKLIFGKDDKTYLSEDEKKSFEKHYCRVQFHPSYDYTDFVEGLRPFSNNDDDSICFKLRDGVFKDFCKKALADKGNFVFVIDEINRGEISKIFGELFLSIDPDYRGKKGKVLTQYTNMLPTKDVFKDGFYVPENVFIIGTMNDIDRSVECFDFAMRRRFVCYEITSETSAKNMGLPQRAAEKMDALNNAISTIDGLDSSYHIGAAYFLEKNGEEVLEPDYSSLWNCRIKPLLREYLRGKCKSDVDKELKRLEEAFRS